MGRRLPNVYSSKWGKKTKRRIHAGKPLRGRLGGDAYRLGWWWKRTRKHTKYGSCGGSNESRC